MAKSSRIIRWLLALGFVLSFFRSLEVEAEVFMAAKVSGTIAVIRPKAIFVVDADNHRWEVDLSGDTKIKVTGTAGLDMLTPGTSVRFTASIDKRTSHGQEKISELTIFTPSTTDPERMLGVVRNGEKHAAADAEPDIPDVKKGPKSHTARPSAIDKSGPDVESFDVAAQVVSYHTGRLAVTVQNKFFKPKINVEVELGATAALDLGDFSHVNVGDEITASGFAKNGLMIKTEEVEIKLSKPLGTIKKPHGIAHGSATAKDDSKSDSSGDSKSVAKHYKKPGSDDASEMPDKGSKHHASGSAARANGLAQFLAPEPADLQARGPLKDPQSLGNGEIYKPCKQVLSKDLRKKFGAPTAAPEPLTLSLIDGEGRPTTNKSEVWTYGKIKIIIDENHKTAYISGAPDLPNEDAAPKQDHAAGKSEPPAGVKPEAKSEDEPEDEPKAEPKAKEPKPDESKPDSQPEPKPEPKPDPKRDPKPDNSPPPKDVFEK